VEKVTESKRLKRELNIEVAYCKQPDEEEEREIRAKSKVHGAITTEKLGFWRVGCGGEYVGASLE